MRDRTLLRSSLWRFAVLFTIAIAACESATDGQQLTVIHPVPPNGNSLITAQRTYDVPAGFDRAADDGRGGHFFSGPGARVGHLDANRDMNWSDDTMFRVGDVRHVDAVGPWSDGVIAVGQLDLDEDGVADAGGVALYDFDGVLLDTVCVFSDTLAVSLKGAVRIASGDPAQFLVVGDVTEGTKRPFAAMLSIASADSTIRVLADSTFTSMDGTSFDGVAAATPPASTAYVIRNSSAGADILAISTTFDVEWTAAVGVVGGQSHKLRAIAVDSGNIFAAGEVQIDKGDYFARAGLIASMTTAGDTNWVDSLRAGGNQDAFDGMTVANGMVYAVGRGEQVFVNPPSANLGYALFCGFDAATGEPKFSRTMGLDDLWSGLRNVFVVGGTAAGFGFREDPNTTVREAWRVDLSVPQTE